MNIKLIYCKECGDYIAVRLKKRSCECGECSCYFQDNKRTAHVTGPCIVLGIDNGSFHVAKLHIPHWPTVAKRGISFEAFIIAEPNQWVVRT